MKGTLSLLITIIVINLLVNAIRSQPNSQDIRYTKLLVTLRDLRLIPSVFKSFKDTFRWSSDATMDHLDSEKRRLQWWSPPWYDPASVDDDKPWWNHLPTMRPTPPVQDDDYYDSKHHKHKKHKTSYPSHKPTHKPTHAPSSKYTYKPSVRPTGKLTKYPTAKPTYRSKPSSRPSNAPTRSPSASTTLLPTWHTTQYPTALESERPSYIESHGPSTYPSDVPTCEPSMKPSAAVTSIQPSYAVTISPSLSPSIFPTNKESIAPSSAVTYDPTMNPTTETMLTPSSIPSAGDSSEPTPYPVMSDDPSQAPTSELSFPLTAIPLEAPTASPSITGTYSPIESPSMIPSFEPTFQSPIEPAIIPSFSPTAVDVLTMNPSSKPSDATNSDTNTPYPSFDHETFPSIAPTFEPSKSLRTLSPLLPTLEPSLTPSLDDNSDPEHSPSNCPSVIADSSFIPTISADSASRQPAINDELNPAFPPSNDPTSFYTPESSYPSYEPTVLINHPDDPSVSLSPSVSPTSFVPSVESSMDSSTNSNEPSTGPSYYPSVLLEPSNIPSNLVSHHPTMNHSLAAVGHRIHHNPTVFFGFSNPTSQFYFISMLIYIIIATIALTCCCTIICVRPKYILDFPMIIPSMCDCFRRRGYTRIESDDKLLSKKGHVLAVEALQAQNIEMRSIALNDRPAMSKLARERRKYQLIEAIYAENFATPRPLTKERYLFEKNRKNLAMRIVYHAKLGSIYLTRTQIAAVNTIIYFYDYIENRERNYPKWTEQPFQEASDILNSFELSQYNGIVVDDEYFDVNDENLYSVYDHHGIAVADVDTVVGISPMNSEFIHYESVQPNHYIV